MDILNILGNDNIIGINSPISSDNYPVPRSLIMSFQNLGDRPTCDSKSHKTQWKVNASSRIGYLILL